MKKLLLLSLFILSASCSSNSKYFAPTENAVIPDKYKIYVGKVDVELREEKLSSGSSLVKYPAKEELSKIFKKEIIAQLQQEGLYSEKKNGSDVFECDFNVNYVRAFVVFTSDKYAGSRLEGYNINVTKNGNTVATRTIKGSYGVNQGLLGNLTKIGKTLSLSANQNDELKEIEIFSKAIAKDLKYLGK